MQLDPRRPSEFAFVSHAHADHFGRHQKVICSKETAGLLHDRFGLAKRVITSLDWGEEWRSGGFVYRLVPAGHIFGSAMLHLTREADGESLLYTGDFKVTTGRYAEPPEFPKADTLIMETTFALPKYVFPPRLEVESDIINFVNDCFADGEWPVLFGYSLGKAQEIHAIVDAHGISVVLHPTVAKMTDACQKLGAKMLPFTVFDGTLGKEQVLICPPNSVRSTALRKLKKKRTAMMSGWAMNAGANFRYRTDAAFPLSDHADHPGLWECVKRVSPKRVLTLHGYAREFATELRHAGYEAWSVFGNDQLELELAQDEATGETAARPRPRCELADLSDLTEQIRMASGRLRKIELISRYLAEMPKDRLALAARYLSGNAFGKGASRNAFNLGSAVIRQAVMEAGQVSLARYREISSAQADSARTARLILEQVNSSEAEPVSLLELEDLLRELAAIRGSTAKASELAQCLRRLHPREGEMLVRLITGGLRIGLKEGLLDEGIAKAFGHKASEVRRAHMLEGDVGEVAQLAADDRLHEAELTPFVPIKCMLASPEETAEGIIERLGGGAMWVEDKFDGIRVQLHKQGDEAAIYSRDLRPLSSEFPEVVEAMKAGGDDFVIDGELIAYAEGRKLNFFDLQKRLGSKTLQGDLFLGESVPVKVAAFDLLWAGGRSLIELPLKERREVLESLNLPEGIDVIDVIETRSVSEMERAFSAAKGRKNEGLIVKDPNSVYAPGRRGQAWLKLKKAMPTLDCVVVKAQQGHGKRAEVLSDYTFAVRDEESGELRIVGKAYSGLTDVEIEELTEHFQKTSLSKRGRVHTVEPEIVLEIAFDSIRRSKRHNSGLAMRFPRIKAIRRDKTIDDIDSLAYAESLVGLD